MKSPTSEHQHAVAPDTIELSQARTPLASNDSPTSPFFPYDPNLHHPNASVDGTNFVQHSPSSTSRPTMIWPLSTSSLPASIHNYYPNYDLRQFPATSPYLQMSTYLPTMPTLPHDVLQSANANPQNNDPSPIVK